MKYFLAFLTTLALAACGGASLTPNAPNASTLFAKTQGSIPVVQSLVLDEGTAAPDVHATFSLYPSLLKTTGPGRTLIKGRVCPALAYDAGGHLITPTSDPVAAAALRVHRDGCLLPALAAKLKDSALTYSIAFGECAEYIHFQGPLPHPTNGGIVYLRLTVAPAKEAMRGCRLVFSTVGKREYSKLVSVTDEPGYAR